MIQERVVIKGYWKIFNYPMRGIYFQNIASIKSSAVMLLRYLSNSRSDKACRMAFSS